MSKAQVTILLSSRSELVVSTNPKHNWRVRSTPCMVKFWRTMKDELGELNTKVNITMRAVGNDNHNPYAEGVGQRRMKVPKPRAFGRARDAKELEKFLFDMEQYFRAVRMDSEEAKVTTATMYLAGDAKLWWRTKYVDIQDGRCVIDTWEDLRRELKAQFFPENVEYNARRNLRDLK
ncbi:Senescence-specific cysteine protease sag39 [Quillaja saponaria]|uniref:Senescence-specific cysteine protease sag39 n=1 Tax=Quillaja saponaria TaxID=32244 RepID=A0AAD7PQN7_QUISA|nr:Senescence-specific cysteine protease sag39 [Quillaja saponaria]